MPRINLLPWREQERKVRRREFLVAIGGAAIAGIIFVGGGKLLYGSWIDAQNAKNNLLKKEIEYAAWLLFSRSCAALGRRL